MPEVYDPLPAPQSARLLPRLACALNVPLFVHFLNLAGTALELARKGINSIKKIVQICVLFCSRISIKNPAKAGLVSLKMFRLFSFDMQT